MKRKTDNFNKFYNKKSNSAVKEQFRQEKKVAKKERQQAIEKRFEEKRRLKSEAGSRKPGVSSRESDSRLQPKDSGLQDSNLIPLNKYIAHSGICSRREIRALEKLRMDAAVGMALYKNRLR